MECVTINLETIVFYWFVFQPSIIYIYQCGYNIYLLTHIGQHILRLMVTILYLRIYLKRLFFFSEIEEITSYVF